MTPSVRATEEVDCEGPGWIDLHLESRLSVPLSSVISMGAAELFLSKLFLFLYVLFSALLTAQVSVEPEVETAYALNEQLLSQPRTCLFVISLLSESLSPWDWESLSPAQTWHTADAASAFGGMNMPLTVINTRTQQ